MDAIRHLTARYFVGKISVVDLWIRITLMRIRMQIRIRLSTLVWIRIQILAS
jgi:hypothetical protein